MKSKERILEEIGDFLPRYALFFAAVCFFETLIIYLFNSGIISTTLFTVFLAPPTEEAIKGTAVFLVAPAIYSAYLYFTQKDRSNPLLWATLAGSVVGSLFGLSESFFQGESMVALGTGLVTHSVWTIALAIGSLLYWIHGEKRLLILVYMLTVSGHVAWNYDFRNPITSILLVGAIPIAAIGYKYMSGSELNSCQICNP